MMTLCYAYTFGAKYYFPLKEPQTISIDRLVRERYGTNAIEPWRETPVTKSKKVKDFDRLVHGLSQRRECLCNIDRIYSAMERYYDEHNTAVPFCTYDEDGNVLHSWRVLLLPYLGYKELYDKIRLDEPWDSEWNKRFHDIAPMCYCCPACREPATAANAYDKACYSAVTVSDAIVTPKQSAALSTDAKRLIVVERRPLYNWMDPEHELQCDELKELLSDPTDRGNHVDGSVWAIGAEAPYEIGAEPLGKINDFVTPDVLFKELSCER